VVEGGEGAVVPEEAVFAVLDLAVEEAGEGVVDAVLAAAAVERVEFVVGVPILGEDGHEGFQPGVVELDAGASAEAALFAGAGDAEEGVQVHGLGGIGLAARGATGAEGFDDGVDRLFEEGERDDPECLARGPPLRRRGNLRFGQPVLHDMGAVVAKVSDKAVMHGLIISGSGLGCLRILGPLLRISSLRAHFRPAMSIDVNETPPQAAPESERRSRRMVERLSDSRLYRDYKASFEKATGLPLMLRPLKAYWSAAEKLETGNDFCAIMARTNQGCANCRAVQRELEEKAQLGPGSLHCFAGLCDSAVPIRVGEELVAFLQTGQILLHQPNREEFTRTTRQLLAWGGEVNLKALEEAYFQTKVFDRGQYEAMLRLLATFAEHLATISNSIELEAAEIEPALVSNAKRYIRDRYHERISLDEAARAVNASTRHFCKIFKQATGITFTDYLARVRVEKAKHLLRNPNLRVSEVAFETGFESISQFNRSFKRIVKRTPTEYRDAN